MKFDLNGSDWELTGYLHEQWYYTKTMETGRAALPAVMPIKATVPGAVQKDLFEAGLVPDFRIGTNSYEMEWVENREWVYIKKFVISEEFKSDRYILCFDGLDFHGLVFINGYQIIEFNQMHLAYKADITNYIQIGDENTLKVVFFQPPEVAGQVGYTSKTTILKTRFNYTWDWCPRLVNIGIYRDVYIKCVNSAVIKDFYPKAAVNGGKGIIDVNLDLECYLTADATVNIEIKDKSGNSFIKEFQTGLVQGKCFKNTYSVEVDNPQLWYPNNMGEQPLYNVLVTITDNEGRICDTSSKDIGFRTIENRLTENAPQNCLPYAIYVNGQNMSIKGVNWVPVSPFYGTVTRKDYEYYIRIFKNMNVNLLRVWGGGLLESEDFYDLCDEYGILVWQEFPQSSSGIDNMPCENIDFVDVLCRVAQEYIINRRHHASLAIWCGGNELMFHNYVPVNENSYNIARLHNVVREYDPGRIFLPASASGPSFNTNTSMIGKGVNHDVHGPWNYLGEIEHYNYWEINDSMLDSEMGAPAVPRLDTLLKCCKGEIWPPDKTNRFWLARGCWWLYLDEMNAFYGEFDGKEKGINEYVKGYRYNQMEALRYGTNINRKKGRHKAGMIIWMANEPYPNSANTSLIEHDGCPKPAFYKVRNSYSKVMLGISYKTPYLAGKESLDFTLFGYSDTLSSVKNINVEVYDEKGTVIYSNCFGDAEVEISRDIAEISVPIAGLSSELLIVSIRAEGERKIADEYIFTLKGEYPFEKVLYAPKTDVAVEKIDCSTFRLDNLGKYAALEVECLGFDENERAAVFDENYFCLKPGESVIVKADRDCAVMYAEALNSRRADV